MGTLPGASDFGTGGGAGNTFPGATVPFGLAVFGPDSFPSADGLPSYNYADTRLKGFSLTHFSGAGCLMYGDVPLLPTTAVARGVSGRPRASGSTPSSCPPSRTASERATPGPLQRDAGPGHAESDRQRAHRHDEDRGGALHVPPFRAQELCW